MANSKASGSQLDRIEYNDISDRQVVGRGAFGTVYKACCKNKIVAIKEFESDFTKEKLRKEIEPLKGLEPHPNIIQFYGVATKGILACIVMEFATCGSLHRYIHSEPKQNYTKGKAILFALHCAQGVSYLHEKNLLHRDLKPANLLLTHDYSVLKICDFGTVAELKSTMTSNRGTPRWMAPEVFCSRKYSGKCDTYSWAIILWELFSRKLPFLGIESCAIQIQVLHGIATKQNFIEDVLYKSTGIGERPKPITHCPQEIKEIIVTCWDPNPSVRYSMAEIVAKMEELSRTFSDAEDLVTEINEDNHDAKENATIENSTIEQRNDNNISKETNNLSKILENNIKLDNKTGNTTSLPHEAKNNGPTVDTIEQRATKVACTRKTRGIRRSRSVYSAKNPKFPTAQLPDRIRFHSETRSAETDSEDDLSEILENTRKNMESFRSMALSVMKRMKNLPQITRSSVQLDTQTQSALSDICVPNEILGNKIKEVERLTNVEVRKIEDFKSGHFGIYFKAKWENETVAVKVYPGTFPKSDMQQKIITMYTVKEHPNFVMLLDVVIYESRRYLKMEFIDGGTLFNFLHKQPKRYYSARQALNWISQLTDAICFLIDKRITYRGLQTRNIYLENEYNNVKVGEVLSIQEAQHLFTLGKMKCYPLLERTHDRFTEKVFSSHWGVIVWEIIFRMEPLSELDNKTFQEFVLDKFGPVAEFVIMCWQTDIHMQPDIMEIRKYVNWFSDIISQYAPKDKAKQKSVRQSIQEMLKGHS